MAKRLKDSEDETEAAHRIISRVISISDTKDKEDPTTVNNPAAAALGRAGGKKGGKKGGKARARSLTPEQRSEIAKKAAETRWKKIRSEKP